jgi:hypothetical protein
LELGASQTICPGWPWTMILPILASQVDRIIVWATGTWLSSLFLASSPAFVYLFDNIHSGWDDTLLWFWFIFPWCLGHIFIYLCHFFPTYIVSVRNVPSFTLLFPSR